MADTAGSELTTNMWDGLPIELVETIIDYISRDDAKALRRVSKAFERNVSPAFFKSVVVPFNSELQDMVKRDIRARNGDYGKGKGKRLAIDDDDDLLADDLSLPWMRRPAKSQDDPYRGHGYKVFRGFGRHIRNFGMTFEVTEDDLRLPPTKQALDRHESFYGTYEWPPADYRRFDKLASLERTADEMSHLRDAMAHLINVKALGLSLNNGHGWLSGKRPYVSGAAVVRPAIFGQSFSDDVPAMPHLPPAFSAVHIPVETMGNGSLAQAALSVVRDHMLDFYEDIPGSQGPHTQDTHAAIEEAATREADSSGDTSQDQTRLLSLLRDESRHRYLNLDIIFDERRFNGRNLTDAEYREAWQAYNGSFARPATMPDVRYHTREARQRARMTNDVTRGVVHPARVVETIDYDSFTGPYGVTPVATGSRLSNAAALKAEDPSSSLLPAKLTQTQKEWLLEADWAQRAFLQSFMLSFVDNHATFAGITSFNFAFLSSAFIPMLCRNDFWSAFPALEAVTLHVSPDWRRLERMADAINDNRHAPSVAQNAVYWLLTNFIGQIVTLKSLNIGWARDSEEAAGSTVSEGHFLPVPLFKHDHTFSAGDLAPLPFIRKLRLSNAYIAPKALKAIVASLQEESLEEVMCENVHLLLGNSGRHLRRIRNPRHRRQVVDNSEPIIRLGSWTSMLNQLSPGRRIDNLEQESAEEFPRNLNKLELIECGYAVCRASPDAEIDDMEDPMMDAGGGAFAVMAQPPPQRANNAQHAQAQMAAARAQVAGAQARMQAFWGQVRAVPNAAQRRHAMPVAFPPVPGQQAGPQPLNPNATAFVPQWPANPPFMPPRGQPLQIIVAPPAHGVQQPGDPQRIQISHLLRENREDSESDYMHSSDPYLGNLVHEDYTREEEVLRCEFGMTISNPHLHWMGPSGWSAGAGMKISGVLERPRENSAAVEV